MHPNKFMQRGKAQAPSFSDAEKADKLEALGYAIAEKRKEAVDARKASGIEEVWLSAEEAYLGIDDMNRAEFSSAKWAKPTSMSGPIVSEYTKKDDTRSTVFVPLTARYVDGAASKLAEIILPIDDKAFSLEPTAVPELVKGKEDLTPLIDGATGQPAMTTEPAPGQPDGQTQPRPMTVADKVKQVLDKAHDAAEKAETRIYDWMMESKYPAEARKVIKDAARIGAGVIKGPIPEITNRKAITSVGGAVALQILQEIKPGQKWVDPWNLFPAEGCGENIHDGDYCLERDYLSFRKLKALKKEPGYLKDQIQKVLDEGPGKVFIDGNNPADKKQKNRFEVWYYYGSLTREDMLVTEAVGVEDEPNKEDFSAIVTMVNDTPIRAIINPMDSGDFPYRVMHWRRRPGMWAGVGVGEQMQVAQKITNASTRALLNNAGISAGPQIIIDQLGIVPADNSHRIYPNKVWYKTGENPNARVQDAFFAINIPSVEREMMEIIQYGMRLAEESTSIPLIAQGQQGPTSPQTFGQAELQNNNSLTWLRDIGYTYDDCITEPLVDAYYEWLLLDPNVPDEEKGDFKINAGGSVAMIERAIQEATIMGLIAVSANPIYEIDPAKLIGEYLKGKRYDPRKLQLSEEEKQKRAQQQQPPAPQVQVAQIRAEADMKKTQMVLGQKSQEAQAGVQLERELAQLDAQTEMQAAKLDMDRDQAYVAAQTQRDRTTAQLQIEELKIKRELALLEYANKKEISLEEVKAGLAQTAMAETTKRQLAQAQIALNTAENHKDRMVDVHKHGVDKQVDMHKHTTQLAAAKPPEPLEPTGRAPAGESFAK